MDNNPQTAAAAVTAAAQVAQKMVHFLGSDIPETYLTIKPLNIAAFIYLASCFAHFFAVAKAGTKNHLMWARFASAFVLIGWVFHTTGIFGRWYVGGLDRPPWTNLYESLIGFAWMFSTFQVYAIFRWATPLVGAVSSPLIFLLMGMSVMTPNKSVEPLIPALQSYWLKIHVVFGMTAYAGFTTAACFAFFHLIKNRVSLSKIGAGLSLVMILNLGIAGGTEMLNTGKFFMTKTVVRTMPDGSEQLVKDTTREYEGGPVITRMEEVPNAHWAFYVSVLGFLLAAIGFSFKRKHIVKNAGEDLERVPFALFGLGMAGLVWLSLMIWLGLKHSPTLTLQSNPYLVMLLLMTFFFGSLYILIASRYQSFISVLPSAERLDELSYKNILFAFPFQTLLLVTGAVWAYYAWGRSWGWDPKETWAFITWVAFLIYLHGKLLMNWRPNLLSVFAIVGFVILVFAFLGVNLVLSGLHSYGGA